VRVLVTGAKGQLGYDVVIELTGRGHMAVGVDIDEMDITDPTSVRRVIMESNVSAVVHCAAFTAVDKAEVMPAACQRVNAEGSRNIAVVCRDLDLKMVYISTRRLGNMILKVLRTFTVNRNSTANLRSPD
jgi:dTDP-4-dehydrorhamnose reductase